MNAGAALRSEKKDTGDGSQFQITERMHRAPLPAGPGARVEMDNTKLLNKWLSRVLLAHYPADKDPGGAAFIKSALDVKTPPGKLVRMGRAMDIAKVTDPGMLYMIGLVEPGMTARAHEANEKALFLFPQSVYPKFLWYAAAGYVDYDTKKASGRDRKAMDDVAMEYLNYGLNDDSFEPDEIPVLREYIDMLPFGGLLTRRRQAVLDMVDAGWVAPQWLKDYVHGRSYVDEAWIARGNDWAGNVTDEGWKGFAKGLSNARARLVKSWTENPKDPAAATAMIAVCMGENEETDTMRTWFDRAVAAQFDFLQAYKSMEWGLYPRWGGSYEEMNAFAEECGATARYDTIVPNERVVIAMDISDDANDHGKQFENPEIADGVLKVLNAYFAEPHPPIQVRYSKTEAAIVADRAGKHDEAVKYLAEIRYRPVPNKELAKVDNLKKLASDAKASANGGAGGASPAPGGQDAPSPDNDEAMPDSTP